MKELLDEVNQEINLQRKLSYSSNKLDEQDSSVWFSKTLQWGSGLAGLGIAVVALANWWNPAGWVWGAVAAVGFIASLFESKASKRRKAVAKISSALESQIEKQEKQIVEDALMHFREQCFLGAAEVKEYFRLSSDGLNFVGKTLGNGAEKLQEQSRILNTHFAARIIDFAGHKPSESSAQALRNQINEVRRKVGESINIEVSSKMRVPKKYEYYRVCDSRKNHPSKSRSLVMTITAAVHGQKFESILARMGELLAAPVLKERCIATKLEQDLKVFRERGFLTIAFVGEYSAGKSSLISALTGRRDLAISADIATDQCREYEWNGVKLIDTPGLWTERKDHDARTYEAIARADLLVYCLTYSLFDTTTLANFKELAFERNYQTKMLLLVNKMSAEAGDVEQRIEHYNESLRLSFEPHDLSQFPIAFCDARDQLDGEDEHDEELKALSRFDKLTALLNKFIDAKGAMARLDTPLRIVLSSLDEVTEFCTRDDGRDDQQVHLLKKLTGVVTRQRRALSIKVEGEISNLAYSIQKIGSSFAKDIGINPDLQYELEQSQYKIEALCQQSSDLLQKEVEAAVESLREEMGEEFESPLMADFIGSANTHTDTSEPQTTDLSGGLKKNVAMFKKLLIP